MLRMTRLAAFFATLGLATAGLVSTSTAAPPTPSVPSSPSIQRLIDAKLKMVPGGRQVGPDKIVWDKLGASMEFGAAGALNCQYEYLCLYGDSDYNDGPDVTPWKLNFWQCGILWDLASWGVQNQTSSAVNNQTPGTGGYIYRKNGASAVPIWESKAFASTPLLRYNDDADYVAACY